MGRAQSGLFVDASAWIALISADDAQHEAAVRLLRLAISRRYRLCTTDLILAEVHRFFLFRAGIRPARVALERIHLSPLVEISYGDVDLAGAAMSFLDRFADQEFSYTDAVSFAFLARGACDSVLTFDRDFAIAGFTPWQG